MSDLVGKSLGKYHIDALVGQGGMSMVYKAYHPGLKRHVAIKTLHKHLIENEGFRGRFEQEAAAAARLRHPNIVRIYDFDDEEGQYYMVMEFIDGPTLKDVLENRLRGGQLLPLNEMAHVVSALCSAVDYAHVQGVIHRDLKPANVMFTADGQVVLTDFGIARIVGQARRTVEGVISGTLAYLSPEQGQGQAGDGRSDIYSLGVMLYEIVTGQVPFQADHAVGLVMKHIREPPPLPTALNPDLPAMVGQVILKALRKDPADRYQRADQLAYALRKAVGVTTDELSTISISLEGLAVGSPVQAFSTPSRTPYMRTPGRTPYSMRTPHIEAPFQPPPDVVRFVGREKELDELSRLLTQDSGQRIYCVAGMGGIGKTALVVHLAHQMRDWFSDGVLWANVAASEPMAILDSWAYAYDYDLGSLPDLDSRAAALRSLLADRKILVVLDDVRSMDRVRPLLLNGSQCMTLLTTRNLELAAALNAYVYLLSPFTSQESLQLMSHILGEERIMSEQACAHEICQLLMHLPLAVEIAAQRLNSRHRWRLSNLIERLRNEKSRLDELSISDREVRTSFAISWKMLDPDRCRSFSLLAVFEGRTFTAAAFAAVAEMAEWMAEDDLYALASLSLVAEEGKAYYSQHPLLADFAREQLGENPSAYMRMANYYLKYAVEHQEDYVALEQEWDNLLGGICVAQQHKMWQTLIDYAEALSKAWFARGYFAEARQGYQWAYEAARSLNNCPALAELSRQWGRACIEQGDYAEAREHLLHSLQLEQQLNDLAGLANVQFDLARIALEQAHKGEAQQLFVSCQEIRAQFGDVAGMAEVLRERARIEYRCDHYAQAEQYGEEALMLQQQAGDRLGSVKTLRLLVDIYMHGLNDLGTAEEYGRRALAICEQLQNRGELAVTLYALSEIFRKRGDLPVAREHAEKSLALLHRMGDRKSQAQVLLQLSLVDADRRDYSLARQEGQQSLELCRELSDDWGVVYVLRHLGDVLQHASQPDQARHAWSEAVEIARRLQHPLRESLNGRLAQSDEE